MVLWIPDALLESLNEEDPLQDTNLCAMCYGGRNLPERQKKYRIWVDDLVK